MKENTELELIKNTEIIVFDMDGTLYQHDGENGTFKNSSLSRSVISNSIKFVMDMEGCGTEAAEKLIKEAQKDSIGISNVLSKRYGITRADYFDIAWNIDPKKVVRNSETAVAVVRKLKENGKRLFLLTASPRVWMENVIRELSLADHFERKIYGELFGNKTEIFEALAKEFDPTRVISVGDQSETDLDPAMALGMSIFKVNKPEDLVKLI